LFSDLFGLSKEKEPWDFLLALAQFMLSEGIFAVAGVRLPVGNSVVLAHVLDRHIA
jgi:hypothetical protein